MVPTSAAACHSRVAGHREEGQRDGGREGGADMILPHMMAGRRPRLLYQQTSLICWMALLMARGTGCLPWAGTHTLCLCASHTHATTTSQQACRAQSLPVLV